MPSSSSLLWLLRLKLILNSTALHLISSSSSMLLLISLKDMAPLKVMDNLSRAIVLHLSNVMVLSAAEAHPTLKAISRLLTKLLSLMPTRAKAMIAEDNLRLLLASSMKLDLLSDPAMSLLPIQHSSIPTISTRVNQTRKLSPPAHSTSLVTLTLKAALSLSRNLTTLLPSLVSSRASSPVFTP